MAAVPFMAVLAVSRGVHAMVASAVFFMHPVMMTGTVRAMTACARMHVL